MTQEALNTSDNVNLAPTTTITTTIKEEAPITKSWIKDYWRHVMGWVYMVICICDFVLFPILWSGLQYTKDQPMTQWAPITLQGAGLIHVSMGAIVGITSWNKTKEFLSSKE